MYLIKGEDVNNLPIEMAVEKHHQHLVAVVTILDSSPMTKHWYVSGHSLQELNIRKEEYLWQKHLQIITH